MNIHETLSNLLKNTNSPRTKRVVGGLLDVHKAGEVNSTNFTGVIYESLSSLKGTDEEVDKALNYISHKTAVANLGLKSVLESLTKTKLYETDVELRDLVQTYEEHLVDKAHSEAVLTQPFIAGIKRYRWNNKVNESMRPMESNIEKFKTFKLVQETIDTLEADKNADLYEDIIRKLDYSFSLPENQVRSYINSIFESELDSHPTVLQLLENLYKIDQSATARTTFQTNRTDGRNAVHERISPVLYRDGKEIFMMNGNLYESAPKEGKIRKITNVLEENIPQEFLVLCNSFTLFEADKSGLTIANDIFEFKIVEVEGENEEEEEYAIQVDGEESAEETPEEMLENLATMGVDGKTIGLLEGMRRNMKDVMVLDNITTVVNESACVDIIQCGNSIFINVYELETQTEELYPAADANIDAITTDIKTAHGVDVTPYVTEAAEEGAGGAGEEGAEGEEDDEAKAEAEAKAAQELEEKEKELEDTQAKLEEVEDNMEKIEVLDEEYREDDDIQKMYDDLKKEKDNLEEKVKSLKAELSGEEGADDTASDVAEKIFAEVEDMRSNSDDAMAQLEADDDPNAVATVSGNVHNIDDQTSVIPVVEFEKTENGAQVSNMYLQVDDKTMNEGDGDLTDKLNQDLEDTKYTVMEDGYVSLAVEPTDIGTEIPPSLKDDIATIVNAISVATDGAADQGLGDAEETDPSGTGDAAMENEEEGVEGAEGADTSEEGEEGAEGAEGSEEEEEEEGAEATMEGVCPMKRVVFPPSHQNPRLQGRSGYVVHVDEDGGTAVIDFDDKKHDPMQYQPNVPLAEVEKYTNDADSMEDEAKSMTTAELVEVIEKNNAYMGDSPESDSYLKGVNKAFETELTNRGKGHLVAGEEEGAEA